MILDASILQYTQIASLKPPKESERDILHTWIDSESLGGHCGFLGRDLGGFKQPSAYAKKHIDDLAMLSANWGEDDMFTRFLSGPALDIFHSLWHHKKVDIHLESISPVSHRVLSALTFIEPCSRGYRKSTCWGESKCSIPLPQFSGASNN
jgi:hypothetical protein